MRTRLEETGQDGGSEEDRKDRGDGMRGGTVELERSLRVKAITMQTPTKQVVLGIHVVAI